MKSLVGRVLLTAALLGAGCSRYRALDPDHERELHRVAILAHVDSGPVVQVAQVDPKEGRAYPTLAPAEADKKLAGALLGQVRRFELQERLRAALVERLPARPPWTTTLPAVEVATALQSLLVEDRSGDIDYKALWSRGADSVLELTVSEFGVHTVKGRTGLYLKGDGRLFTREGSTLWKAPLDLDDALDLNAEPANVVALRDGGFREAIIGLVGRLSERLADDLRAREEKAPGEPAKGPAEPPVAPKDEGTDTK